MAAEPPSSNPTTPTITQTHYIPSPHVIILLCKNHGCAIDDARLSIIPRIALHSCSSPSVFSSVFHARRAGEMEKEEEERVKEVIAAVYKVNLHCPQCASQIRQPLLRTQGVHEVEATLERNEIKVKGRIDPKRIQERIRRLIRREVEMVVPAQTIKARASVAVQKAAVKVTKGEQGSAKNATVITEKAKEVKEQKLSTTTFKVHLHCETCGHDLQRMLIKRKGIYSVKTDMKAQTLTVEGIVDPSRVQAYLQKKVKKHAEIVIPKPKEIEKKKERPKVEAKSPAQEKKKSEQIKEENKGNSNWKAEGKSSTEEKKKSEESKGEGDRENARIEAKSFMEEEKFQEKEAWFTNTGEERFKEKEAWFRNMGEEKFKEKEAGLRNKDGSIPYFVHYVYAPQLFSDEDPNACSIL